MLEPYPLVCLLLALALLNLWRKRRETRRRLVLLTIPVVGLVLLSTPVVSYFALGTLEWQYSPSEELPADAEAIVVLGGGYWPGEGESPRPELAPDSMYRCIHAARLYKSGKPRPVLVSGGMDPALASGPSCAEVMRDFLLLLGVREADVVVEGRSLTTYENALECSKILDQRRLGKVVLVTEATHMARAVKCFRRQGVEVVPSPCRFRALTFPDRPFLPAPEAAHACRLVVHEWLGTLWYWAHGRI